MNSKQHRSITRDVEDLNREIIKEMQSLKTLEKYSSRVETKSPIGRNNQTKQLSKVLQIKPSSKGHKGYTVSQLQVTRTVGTSSTKYQVRKQLTNQKYGSGKENIGKNLPVDPPNGLNHRNKLSGSAKAINPTPTRCSLKTQTSSKYNRSSVHQRSTQYGNPNHYVSEQIVGDALFGDYQLSNSGSQEDELFPDDSLNFQLKEDYCKENQVERSNYSYQPDQRDLVNLIKLANTKQQARRTQKDKPVEYTFKPTILDRSKQIADKMGSSYTRLTAKSKNTTKENTYRQPSTNTRAYSRQRLNTLSRPRMITEEVQPVFTEECTFKPVLSKKSLNQFNGCYLDVVERNMLWLNQKQQKLEKIKEVEEQEKSYKQKIDCSAIKMRNQYRPDREVSLSKFGKEGLIGYFQRVQQATDNKKREKQAEMKYSGRGWNGSVTKPQEFRLSANSPNQLSYRSRSKTNAGGNQVEREYEKAIKQLHDKIQKLNL